MTLPRNDSPRQLPLFDPIEIPLTRGQVTIVDPVDTDLAALKWYAQSEEYRFYAARRLHKPRVLILLHRVIMERMLGRPLVRGEYVDHISGDGLDNRRSNLRVATPSQNRFNSQLQRNSTSKLKGVSWHKRNQMWQAAFTFNDKDFHLGYFNTPEEAHAAYCEAARKYAGEFARTE